MILDLTNNDFICPCCGTAVKTEAGALITDVNSPTERRWHMWCAVKHLDDIND